MTLKVYKSHTAGLGEVDFAAAVEAHRQALLAHRFTGDVAPTAHHLVEAAVVRVPCEGGPDDFLADFEVIDDTPAPPAPPTPAQVRDDLLSRVRSAEFEAATAVIGNGALRLLSLDAREAAMKPAEERTAADTAALDRLQDVTVRRTAVDRHAATIEAAIEAMPFDQLATYEFPAFTS